MKKSVAAFFLVFASATAFALPTPKDIEAAVKAGNLAQAETMLHEVIAAKPGSAKAHYELGQVLAREGRLEAARQQLAQAERLDPSLKFASDPLQFRNLMNQVSTAASAPASLPARAAGTSSQTHSAGAAGFPWGMLLLGGGVLVILWLVIRRMMAAGQASRYARESPAGLAAAGGATGTYGNYGAGVPPAGSGSGIGGAVLGGVAGLAAGYGLARILENSDGHRPAAADNAYAPIESPQQDFGSFDAGAGGDWDGGGDSSGGDGGDDSW